MADEVVEEVVAENDAVVEEQPSAEDAYRARVDELTKQLNASNERLRDYEMRNAKLVDEVVSSRKQHKASASYDEYEQEESKSASPQALSEKDLDFLLAKREFAQLFDEKKRIIDDLKIKYPEFEATLALAATSNLSQTLPLIKRWIAREEESIYKKKEALKVKAPTAPIQDLHGKPPEKGAVETVPLNGFLSDRDFDKAFQAQFENYCRINNL